MGRLLLEDVLNTVDLIGLDTDTEGAIPLDDGKASAGAGIAGRDLRAGRTGSFLLAFFGAFLATAGLDGLDGAMYFLASANVLAMVLVFVILFLVCLR